MCFKRTLWECKTISCFFFCLTFCFDFFKHYWCEVGLFLCFLGLITLLFDFFEEWQNFFCYLMTFRRENDLLLGFLWWDSCIVKLGWFWFLFLRIFLLLGIFRSYQFFLCLKRSWCNCLCLWFSIFVIFCELSNFIIKLVDEIIFGTIIV